MKKLLSILLIVAVLVSCKKEDAGKPESSEYPYYFIATVNGNKIKYEADDLGSNYGCGTTSPQFGIGDSYDIYEGTFFMKMGDFDKNTVYVRLLKHFNHDPDVEERAAIFKIGSYPFGVLSSGSPTVDGASISYLDANGKEWFSESGSQSGSSFAITELEDNEDFTAVKLFKAEFSCRLYDEDGNSIEIKNAVVKGKAVNP